MNLTSTHQLERKKQINWQGNPKFPQLTGNYRDLIAIADVKYIVYLIFRSCVFKTHNFIISLLIAAHVADINILSNISVY